MLLKCFDILSGKENNTPWLCLPTSHMNIWTL